MKKKTFNPESKAIKYRDGLWIQSRKRVYLYWFKFLQEALKSDMKVNWSCYIGWGTKDELLNSKFDDWWESHWKDLFGTETQSEIPKFPLSTNRPKANGLRTALFVYQFRNLESNLEIADAIRKREKQLRSTSLLEFNHSFDIQNAVSRFKGKANKILANVCNGQFP